MDPARDPRLGGAGAVDIDLILQAAEQEWARDPDAARGHVRSASAAAHGGLDEVRQAVHDLAPVGLEGGSPEDLRDEVRRVVERGALHQFMSSAKATSIAVDATYGSAPAHDNRPCRDRG